MVKNVKRNFTSKQEINDYFKEDVFSHIVEDEREDEVKRDYFIKGFPVDFDGPFEIVIPGNSLPLFSKKAGSEIFYSAGYYCLHFPKNWMPAFCPKLSTLQAYEYLGPYKTEKEMRFLLGKIRKEKNDRSKQTRNEGEER
ncbi:MAG: hypothetical protein C5B52_08770 [Bacteroidetes bacterium]|nr:MAG: hypothetical protein C5B52_08770 [Bacteroidota bacterium]